MNPGLKAQALALHLLDNDVVEQMLKWGTKRHGKVWFDQALDDYLDRGPGTEADAELAPVWAVYHFKWQRRTIVRGFLEERGDRLSEQVRNWLESQMAAWLSIWEVLEVQRGESVRVRDLLTGEERLVHEVKGSETLSLRDAVLTRVVDHAGLSVFCGMHGNALTPRDAAVVVGDVQRACHAEGFVGTKALRGLRIQRRMIDIWRAMVAGVEMRPLPQFANTDGEPFLLTRDHFDFKPEVRAEILARLMTMPGADRGDNLDGPEAGIHFFRPGAASKAWDVTLVGSVLVGPARLKVETNSIRRADDLRAKLEAALAGLEVRHRIRDHSDVEAVIKARQRAGGKPRVSPPAPVTPEVQEMVREFKTKHMTAWLDDHIPALDGLTPREATAKPESRTKLDLLLRDMENRESRLPPEEQVDIRWLRHELDLPS